MTEVPALEFAYLTPADKRNTTFAKVVPITVVPAAATPAAAAGPLDEPDELFHIATGPDVLREGDDPPAPSAWLWLVLLGPTAGLAWYVGWRRHYPDAAALARSRRSRASRLALRAIGKADRAGDPAAVLAAAVRQYLQDRAALPRAAVTPGEVHAWLESPGRAAPGLLEAAVRFLQSCDAARFSPAGGGAASLAAEARGLVAAWEAA